MQYWKMTVQILALIVLAGCSKAQPAAQCGTPQIQRAYIDSIFSSLLDSKEREEASILGDKALKQVRDMVSLLRETKPISLGAITAERFDPDTGNLDCRVEVNFKPQGDFASQSVQDQAHEMEDARSSQVFPEGFFEGQSQPMAVIFELRRDPDGKQIARGGAGFDSLVRLAYELLSARSLSDATLAASPGRNPNFKPIDTVTQILPSVGQCFDTQVRDIGFRLEGVPDSGTSVIFEDGHYMIDYTVSKNVSRWQSGDSVKLCVVSLPTNCPKDDNRGVTYEATNSRTMNTWIAADSEHMCGGA